MLDSDQALNDFIEAWNAGRRPDAADFLARVPPEQRDELADQITTWLAVAPAPAYDEPTRAQIRSERVYRTVVDALESEAGAWPSVLPALRARAGLSLGDLAARLTRGFGLTGQEERTADYLERMERGTLDARGVSRRLLAALAAALGARPNDLQAAGAMGARPAAAALFRREAEGEHAFLAEELEAVALAARASKLDELDRLFTGGPEA